LDPRRARDRVRRQPRGGREARARARERSRDRRDAPRRRRLPRGDRARAQDGHEAAGAQVVSGPAQEPGGVMKTGSVSGVSGAPGTVAGRATYALLHNTSEVVTADPEGTRVLRIPRGAVVFRDGRVLEIGNGPELSRRHVDARPINAGGKLVTPGLVDCHTHMIFGGQRALEFQRRLRGEDYATIASGPAGATPGGIRSTVAATAAERDDALEKSLAG